MTLARTAPTVGALVLAALPGCAAPADQSWPEPRPLGRGLPTFRPPHAAPLPGDAAAAPAPPVATLTLQQATALALQASPRLAAAAWEVRAREAEAHQAGALPNPELEVEVEEVGGPGERKELRGAEASVSLQQTFELGGKRAARVRVATLETDLAGWDYEAARLEVQVRTTRAFVAVLASQQRLALAQESVALAERVLRAVTERVATGKVSPLEQHKARIACALQRIEHEQAQRALVGSRRRLAACWGADEATFRRVAGELATLRAVPPLETVLELSAADPDVARWGDELALRRAAIEREEALRWPDLTLRGGVTRFEEAGEQALVFGVSIPLPLFDRNQGALLGAQRRLAKAEQQRRAAAAEARVALVTAYTHLEAARRAAQALEEDVLPGAQRVFDAMSEGYRQGKFGTLDVLDAQRTLLDARTRHVTALESYHCAAADLERLIGRPVSPLGATAPPTPTPRRKS